MFLCCLYVWCGVKIVLLCVLCFEFCVTYVFLCFCVFCLCVFVFCGLCFALCVWFVCFRAFDVVAFFYVFYGICVGVFVEFSVGGGRQGGGGGRVRRGRWGQARHEDIGRT